MGAAAWGSARTADGLTAVQFAGFSGVAAAMGEVLSRLAPQQAAGAAGSAAGGTQGAEEAEGSVGDGKKDRVVGEADRGAVAKPQVAEPESSVSVQQPATPRRCR